MSFSERVRALPHLGLGISTEYGAGDARGALDPRELQRRGWSRFLEVGVETTKGLDAHARAWAAAGLPTTYHFLDVNLDEPEDFDAAWLDEVREGIEVLSPAWLCGDAGLWHFGPRDRGHMLLLPPVLTDAHASELAEGIVRLRDEVGLEVLPENPPGHFFLGDLDLLGFFARVCERADTGLVLDCAHLAMFQRWAGLGATDGLDDFPLDRVVELHVAGGTAQEHEGFGFVEDDHGGQVLAETWAIVERVVAGAENLKAVVVECERNPVETVEPLFRKTAGIWS